MSGFVWEPTADSIGWSRSAERIIDSFQENHKMLVIKFSCVFFKYVKIVVNNLEADLH